MRIQQEKGPEVRIIEFFDDNIKKYEFQLGITPGILEASLVRENQQLQEKRERMDSDTMDLGRQAQLEQPANISVFVPPKINNFGNMHQTFDQNQTIKLGGHLDDTIQNGKPQVFQPYK